MSFHCAKMCKIKQLICIGAAHIGAAHIHAAARSHAAAHIGHAAAHTGHAGRLHRAAQKGHAGGESGSRDRRCRNRRSGCRSPQVYQIGFKRHWIPQRMILAKAKLTRLELSLKLPLEVYFELKNCIRL